MSKVGLLCYRTSKDVRAEQVGLCQAAVADLGDHGGTEDQSKDCDVNLDLTVLKITLEHKRM